MSESTIILPYAETIWKPIPEWEGLYEASNMGLIKSLSRTFQMGKNERLTTEGILRPKFNKDCYLEVTLCAEGRQIYARIHRLVALTFIPNPDNKPIVDHENGVRWDNRALNLKWSTQSENIQDAFNYGRKSVQGKAVDQYTLEGEFIKRFDKIVHVEKEGICHKNVNAVVKGTRKSAAGFFWKYAE